MESLSLCRIKPTTINVPAASFPRVNQIKIQIPTRARASTRTRRGDWINKFPSKASCNCQYRWVAMAVAAKSCVDNDDEEEEEEEEDEECSISEVELERKTEVELELELELEEVPKAEGKCRQVHGKLELLECLEKEALMGADQGRDPTDYNRRAQIFDKSSKVFRALHRQASSIPTSSPSGKASRIVVTKNQN